MIKRTAANANVAMDVAVAADVVARHENKEGGRKASFFIENERSS